MVDVPILNKLGVRDRARAVDDVAIRQRNGRVSQLLGVRVRDGEGGVAGEQQPNVLGLVARADSRRRMWRRETPHGDLPETATADMGVRVEDGDVVRRALNRLPAAQRQLVVLRFLLGGSST